MTLFLLVINLFTKGAQLLLKRVSRGGGGGGGSRYQYS